jgi:hypothetical protein
MQVFWLCEQLLGLAKNVWKEQTQSLAQKDLPKA